MRAPQLKFFLIFIMVMLNQHKIIELWIRLALEVSIFYNIWVFSFILIYYLIPLDLVNTASYLDNHAPACYKYLRYLWHIMIVNNLQLVLIFIYRCDQDELPEGDMAPIFNKVFRFIGTLYSFVKHFIYFITVSFLSYT